MKLNFLIITATLIFSINTSGQPSGGSKPGSPSHQVFNGLLQKYVSATGNVNYKGLKKDKTILEGYLSELAKQIPDNSWSKNASLAYWINTYNAFTLKLIIDNYPISSITKLYNGKPWDEKWITLSGKKYSLNNIENDIIRPQFKDGRIHFAVNCAAVSCPPLFNTAYTEANVNSLLDTRARNFVNSAANEITTGKIKVSKIFDWYKADFGDVATFINKYSNTKVNANATIEYKEYSWNLNEQ